MTRRKVVVKSSWISLVISMSMVVWGFGEALWVVFWFVHHKSWNSSRGSSRRPRSQGQRLLRRCARRSMFGKSVLCVTRIIKVLTQIWQVLLIFKNVNKLLLLSVQPSKYASCSFFHQGTKLRLSNQQLVRSCSHPLLE